MDKFAYCGSAECNDIAWKKNHPGKKMYSSDKTYKQLLKPDAKGPSCPDCGSVLVWNLKKDLRRKIT